MLADLGGSVGEINFVGVRGTRAAVFLNSHKAAEDLVIACHLRVLRGSLLRCRLSAAEDLDSMSELPDDVTPGDVVEIHGLQSATGSKMNGLYGKVLSFDVKSGRFAVRTRMQRDAVLLKPDNVRLGMKASEMSDPDEALILELQS